MADVEDYRLMDQAHPMDVLWAEIRSLEGRAHSREQEALRLGRCEAERIQSLEREGRELRKRAQALRKHRADCMTRDLGEEIAARIGIANQR